MSDNQLPVGWASGRFGELWTVSQNGCGARSGTGTPTVVLRLADVTIEGRIAEDRLREIPLSGGDREKYALAKGDLLAFRVNGSPQITGQVICYQGLAGSAFCDHFIRFRIREECLDPRFVAYAFRVPPCRSQVARAMVSTAGQNTVSQKSFSDVQLPVPPLPEQHRIVEAIESYFTRLDDAVATLEGVQRNLKRYRASVLKAAVEGRLVPTEAELARAEDRDYEPASVLMERILVERRRRWQEAKARGKYQEPIAADTSNLPKLPEGWCWTTVDALIWDAGYGTSQKCTYEATGPPVLRIPNVQNQNVDLDDLKFATEVESLNPDGIVEPSDLLFIRTNGSRGLIGRGSVILQQLPCAHHFASYLIRLRIVHVDAVPRWTGLAWHTPVLRSQILAEAASSAGQYNVSLTAARAFAVPLPPLPEQHRIIAEVEKTTSLVDACEEIVAANEGRCSRLRQAILKWAFEGKLADQDPSDEPASALLERIRSQTLASRPSAGDTGDWQRRRGDRRTPVRAENKP